MKTKWIVYLVHLFLLFHIYSYILMGAKRISRLSKIYYSPQGYWKGVAAIKKLAWATKVSDDVARNWLIKQALWQVNLPAPQHIPRPKFDVPVPNEAHQADLLYLPHDRPPCSRKTFQCALTVVDVASLQARTLKMAKTASGGSRT